MGSGCPPRWLPPGLSPPTPRRAANIWARGTHRPAQRAEPVLPPATSRLHSLDEKSGEKVTILLAGEPCSGGDDSLHPRSLRLKYHGNCPWGTREKGDLAPCALDRDCAGPTGVALRAKWAVDGVLEDANLCHVGVRAPGTWGTSPASTLDFCRWQAPGQAENKKGQVGAWRRHWAQRKAPDHTLCGPPEEGVGMEGRQRQREPG